MRWIILLSLIILIACNNNEQKRATVTTDTLKTIPETTHVTKETKPDALLPKTYSNKRFKDVTVKKIAKDKFLIRGQAQIFEANFSWIVEDGHEELKKGSQMTDAGAPEWANLNLQLMYLKSEKIQH